MYANVINALLGSVWASTPEQMEAVLSVADGIMGGRDSVRQMRSDYLAAERDELRTGPAYGSRVRYLRGGTAIVPISGVIMPKANIFMAYSGGTSSMSLRNAALGLAQDTAVKRVILHIDSGGGAVVGIEEAADALLQLRAKKPVIAVINGIGASAAYWLASAAHKIYAEPSSIVGSIGVFAMIHSTAEKAEKEGIDVRVIRRGRLKAVPNSYEPITEEGVSVVQKGVDRAYQKFVQAIAKNRNITMKKAEALADGTVEVGTDAKERGLVDEVANIEVVVNSADAGDLDDIFIADGDERPQEVMRALGAENADTLVDDPNPVAADEPSDDPSDEDDEGQTDETDTDGETDTEDAEESAELAKARAELAAARKELEDGKIEAALAAAITAGKILPKNAEEMREVARSIGFAQFERVIAALPVSAQIEDLSAAVQSSTKDEPVKEGAPTTESAAAMMRRFPSLRKRYNL